MKKTLTAVALSALLASATVPAFAQTAAAPAAPTAAAPTTPAGSEMRAGDLIGAEVTNSVGETVGEVQDLVFGPDQKLSAAIVSVGGFLGVGDKLVSIALSDIQVTPKEDGEFQVLVSATKDELTAMPEVEVN